MTVTYKMKPVRITAGRYSGMTGVVSMTDPATPDFVVVLLRQGIGADGVFHAGNVPVLVSDLATEED